MEQTAEEQLLTDIKLKAKNKYEVEQDEIDRITETFYTNLQNSNYDKALQELNTLESDRGWVLQEEKQFLKDIKDPGEVETVGKGKIETKLPKREKLILQKQVSDTEQDDLLLRTDKSVGTEQVFNVCESFYRDTAKSVFVISNQQEWDGRISVELSDTKEKYELLKVYTDKDDGLYFKHFGQKNPNKGYNQVTDLNKSFYEYKFVADDKEYLALSTERLDTVRCNVKGMKVSLNDYKTVGEESKIAVNQDIIFVHSVDPAIETLNEQQLDTYRDGLDHDDLITSLLGGWRQPEWFEKLMVADLMVNDENDYPSHFIWLSKPGTGKSKAIESLLRSLDEHQKEPFTGSGSTVKGLVPSFKDSPPDEGYLLQTQRIAAVDEKMDLLSNSVKQGGNSNDVFRPLLNLLTHDPRKFESGNGSIKGQMMSTMWATGNFNAYGIQNMKQLANKVDTAYLSRCIIYSQTESHVDFINRKKAEVKQKMQEKGLSEDDLFPERDDEFISMLDTMREEKYAQIDFLQCRDIHDELMEKVPGYMREVFRQRGAHHIENITLGITKYHYLVEDRESLEAKDKDYRTAKKLFELIISGWMDVDTEKLSVEARKEALTPPQRRVLNVINDTPGIEKKDLFEKVDVDSFSWTTTSLKREGLVAVSDEGEYYPHFTDEFDELTEGDQVY